MAPLAIFLFRLHLFFLIFAITELVLPILILAFLQVNFILGSVAPTTSNLLLDDEVDVEEVTSSSDNQKPDFKLGVLDSAHNDLASLPARFGSTLPHVDVEPKFESLLGNPPIPMS